MAFSFSESVIVCFCGRLKEEMNSKDSKKLYHVFPKSIAMFFYFRDVGDMKLSRQCSDDGESDSIIGLCTFTQPSKVILRLLIYQKIHK